MLISINIFMIKTKLDYYRIDYTIFPEIAYRLTEIEFYLNCASHSDPYVHCDSDQLLMHKFYFHKFKTGTYKAGTFKGLDLTFGSDEDNTYFGILIRSIQSISDDVVIEGPCNVVNYILQKYNCESILDFTDEQNLDIVENDKQFCLIPDVIMDHVEILVGPRIGLLRKF